jgi:hypothetical protein
MIERDIQRQDIDSRLTEQSQIGRFGVFSD